MNILIQNILVVIVVSLAVGFLVKKFIWNPAAVFSKKKTNGCDSNGCGCH